MTVLLSCSKPLVRIAKALATATVLIVGACQTAFAISAGCAAVNAGGFNITNPGGGSQTILNFAKGDQITFTGSPGEVATLYNSPGGSLVWQATFTQTTLSYTIMGTINGIGPDTSLREVANEAITATCVPAGGFSGIGFSTIRAMQVSVMPVVAQVWGQNLVDVTTGAIGAGLSGNPLPFSPTPNGFTYYFTADPEAERNLSESDSVNRFLASPDGSDKRQVADDFSALGYAGPLKAPPIDSTPRDWLAWVDVRGTNLNSDNVGGDLRGGQTDLVAGVTQRMASNLVMGGFAGYETFGYSSEALAGTLKGNGWTTGGFVGWNFAPQLRFEGTVAGAYVGADDAASGATGSFPGYRLLTSGTVVGTYDWRALKLEPSLEIYGVWEHDNPFTDSTGTQQPSFNFSTGRTAAGGKVSYPIAWMGKVTVAPYLGVYGDYYFSQTGSAANGLTTLPLLQGWGVRGTGGLAFNLFAQAQLIAGGEYEVTADNYQIWTWNVAGRIPF